MRRKGRILSEVDSTYVRNIIKFWPLLTILSLFGEFELNKSKTGMIAKNNKIGAQGNTIIDKELHSVFLPTTTTFKAIR